MENNTNERLSSGTPNQSTNNNTTDSLEVLPAAPLFALVEWDGDVSLGEIDDSYDDRETDPRYIKIEDSEWPLTVPIVLEKLKQFVSVELLENKVSGQKHLYVRNNQSHNAQSSMNYNFSYEEMLHVVPPVSPQNNYRWFQHSTPEELARFKSWKKSQEVQVGTSPLRTRPSQNLQESGQVIECEKSRS